MVLALAGDSTMTSVPPPALRFDARAGAAFLAAFAAGLLSAGASAVASSTPSTTGATVFPLAAVFFAVVLAFSSAAFLLLFARGFFSAATSNDLIDAAHSADPALHLDFGQQA